MSADSLYDNIRGYLRLTTRLIRKVGSDINVGENFTMRFTASNTTYPTGPAKNPDIVFLQTRIFIEGTQFATPDGGNAWHNVPDRTLFPGEASSIDIRFRAISDLPWRPDIAGVEKIARVWIQADLDQNRFFKIKNFADIHQEIDNT